MKQKRPIKPNKKAPLKQPDNRDAILSAGQYFMNNGASRFSGNLFSGRIESDGPKQEDLLKEVPMMLTGDDDLVRFNGNLANQHLSDDGKEVPPLTTRDLNNNQEDEEVKLHIQSKYMDPNYEAALLQGNAWSGTVPEDSNTPSPVYGMNLSKGHIFFSGNMFHGRVAGDDDSMKPLHVLNLKEEGATHEQTLRSIEDEIDGSNSRGK